VQGPETVPSVVAALARRAREDVDCIALMRGGGANADLSWFNDYAIGRAVCLCPIPVIVGIGHDRDETLPDRLARSRSTPTAVAETLAKQILAAWTDRAARSGAAMERVKGGLVAAHGRLRNAGQRLELRVLGRIARQRERLGVARTRLAGLPQRLATTQLPLRGQRLRGAAARSLERAGHVLEIRERDLAARDPVKLLARGYARLATSGGRIVRRAADLAPGQDVRLRMADGTAVARIQEVTIRPSSEEIAP
jgi:exodeoxyribonuclease VII large subunit